MSEKSSVYLRCELLLHSTNIKNLCLWNTMYYNKITEMEKTKFRKYYDALPPKTEVAPKTAFVRRIAELCMVSEKTVRCWLAGAQKPNALCVSIIAKEIGIPESELFD